MCVDVVAGLGVAALPLSSYATESEPVTVSATIDEELSITTNADSNKIDLGVLGAGLTTKSIDVTVSVSESTKGYNLVVKDLDDDTALHLDGDTSDDDNKIESNAVEAGTTGWGVRVGDSGAFNAMLGYNTAGVTLKSEGTATVAGDKTTVTFGASYDAEDALESGEYTDEIVFIATAVTD